MGVYPATSDGIEKERELTSLSINCLVRRGGGQERNLSRN